MAGQWDVLHSSRVGLGRRWGRGFSYGNCSLELQQCSGEMTGDKMGFNSIVAVSRFQS